MPPRSNNNNDHSGKMLRRNANYDAMSRDYASQKGGETQKPNKLEMSPTKRRMLRKAEDNGDEEDQFYGLQHSSITANAGPSKVSLK